MAGGESVRSVALVGANGSGKTTLLESLLFVSGAIGRKGKVGEGNMVGDSSTEARERGMSVEVNAATIEADGGILTLLDCPGSIEFAQEARGALCGVVAVVLVVEPSLERMIAISPLLRFLDAHDIPHLIFINKMDRSEVRYRDLLDSLRGLGMRWLHSVLNLDPGNTAAHRLLADHYAARTEEDAAFAELARRHRSQLTAGDDEG